MGFYKTLLDNIEITLMVIGVLVAILIYFLYRTGWLYRLLDMWKPYSDKHIASKMFCDDRQIRNRKLTVGKYVITDAKKKVSFYLVHKLLLQRPGRYGRFLPVAERNARPIDFHDQVSEVEWQSYPDAQEVFIYTTDDIENEAARNSQGSFVMTALSIMALVVGVIVAVGGIVVLWGNRG